MYQFNEFCIKTLGFQPADLVVRWPNLLIVESSVNSVICSYLLLLRSYCSQDLFSLSTRFRFFIDLSSWSHVSLAVPRSPLLRGFNSLFGSLQFFVSTPSFFVCAPSVLCRQRLSRSCFIRLLLSCFIQLPPSCCLRLSFSNIDHRSCTVSVYISSLVICCSLVCILLNVFFSICCVRWLLNFPLPLLTLILIAIILMKYSPQLTVQYSLIITPLIIIIRSSVGAVLIFL